MSLPKSSELHLFIIWEKARSIEEKILEDIDKKFEIIKTFEITWTKKRFSQNLSRFYGTKLPAGSSKEKHCGTGPFLLIVVEDKKPEYKSHDTSKGPAHVNTNLFSSKTLHREWSGGGHRIHATNSMRETDHDLMLLTGLTVSEFWKKYGNKSSKKPEKVASDVIGYDGWESLKQFFKVMNACEPYVVLRNFSVLPNKYYADKHGDIDLLVSSLDEATFIANSKPVFNEPHRVHHKIRIGGEDILFDFRYLGDNYYDRNWQNSILETRNIREGFHIPNKENHFYSLLYHALVHKPEFAPDYREQLISINKATKFVNSAKVINDQKKSLRALGNYLFRNDYHLTTPIDSSVFINHDNLSYVKKYLRAKKALSPKHYLRKAKSLL